MIFEYKEYLDGLFSFPLILFMIGIALFIVGILAIFKVVKINEKHRLIRIILIFALVVLFTIEPGIQLSKGIKLLSEKDEDTIKLSGSISSIDNDKYSPRFYYDGNSCFGSYITVNNTRVYIMDIGELEIGDQVTITYLPKSKIVLEVTIE